MISNYKLCKGILGMVGIIMLDMFMVSASKTTALNAPLQNSNRSEMSLVRQTAHFVPSADEDVPKTATIPTGRRIKLYVPPADEGAPKTTTRPTGRRNGCSAQLNQKMFRVLAPDQSVGRTHVIRPSFSWYVPDKAMFPMKFQLYQGRMDQERESPPLLEHELESSQGIMTMSLSEEQLHLSIGQEYWWQVVVYCEGRGRPASALAISAELIVISPSKSISSQLAIAKGAVERAKILAGAGFWYDAFAEVGKGRTLEEKQTREILLKDLDQLERDF